MQHIVVATDFSARADRALARALSLAEQCGASLRLLCAFDDELPDSFVRALRKEAEQALTKAAAMAQSRGVQASWAIELGRPYAAILTNASQQPCDLIVVGGHRNDAFSDLFFGTTVERVMRYGQIPVLMVRDRPERSYDRIVVTTDFSPGADRALAFALMLSPRANFFLVHAFETPFPGFLPRENYAPEIRQELTERLRDCITHARSQLAGGPYDIQPLLVEGSVDAELRQAVRERAPQLIALGTHGRTGIAHAVLGSTAERFLSHPPCDVLVIKA